MIFFMGFHYLLLNGKSSQTGPLFGLIVMKSNKIIPLYQHLGGSHPEDFHSNPKERQCQRSLNYCTMALMSHTSEVTLKILQARLQQYANRELQMFKPDLVKAEEPEIKLPTSAGSLKKQESSRKTPVSALLTMPKPLTVWITRNCGKF